MKTYVLGGGCFWCLDAVYQQTSGVKSVVSGYTGGGPERPDYESVASGRTGHAEVVAVTFDPEVVPADVVLGLFFVTHDPTTLNRQGYDVGPQYRSAMFYAGDEDKAEFIAARDAAAANWPNEIVTEIEPLGEFFPAEDVHQNFYAEHPFAGYCQVIINPKLGKARKAYSAWLS